MSLEYPCVHFDNQKCKKFSEPGYTDWCVMGPCSHETPSQADLIRRMTDEEVGTLIHAISLGYKPWCDYHCENECDDGCDKCVAKWLQEPAEIAKGGIPND